MKQSIQDEINAIHRQIEELSKVAQAANNCTCALGPKMEVAQLNRKLKKLNAQLAREK